MIADMIPQCEIVADIGTDHAYIPIYTVLNRICKKCLAADLRKGPLEMALANIKRHGLEDRIETRLGNGLNPVALTECDVIVIAGMGGPLIRDILETSPEKARKAQILLLQPNSAAEALRKWLYETGFDIVEEKLVQDAGKQYCVLRTKWLGIPVIKDDFTYFIGEKVFEGNEKLLESYLEKKLNEIDVIINGRSRSDPEKERKYSDENGMDTNVYYSIREKLDETLKKMNNDLI